MKESEDKEENQGIGKESDEDDQGCEEYGFGHYTCKISRKDRNVVWRNFDTISTKMGIKRELVKTLVKENKEGKI